nr:hypothetical protein [Brucella intermedia]
MSFGTAFLKYATVSGLLLLLSGCFDSEINVVITSDKTAKGTVTIVGPTKEFEGTTFGPNGNDATVAEICTILGTFSIGQETSTCRFEDEGGFDEIKTKLYTTLRNVRPGIVRYELETATFEGAPKAGWENYLAKVTISGGTVIDSNMKIALDRKSVSQTLAVDDMARGKKGRSVPDVYFAEFEVSPRESN